MSNWTTRVTTVKGRALDAKVIAGKTKLTLTKFKTGDGSPVDLENLTDLVSPQQVIPISSLTPKANGEADVEGIMTNAGLEKGYFFKEWGLFAQDPDEGEILYQVLIDANPDYWLADGSATALSTELHLTIAIKDADSVSATIDPSGLVSQSDLTAHDTSDSAHEKRFGLFQKIATLGEDLLKKLALTTTISAITALTTDSWFGQLLKMVLTASGVRYLAAQNGYICFGSFFGNLIIQWGHGYQGDVYYPVAFNLLIPRILTQHEGIDFYQTKPSGVSLTRFTLTVVGDGTAKDADWYAVGA